MSGSINLTIGNADGLLDLIKPLFPPQDNSFSIVSSVVQSLKGAESEVDGIPSITLPVAIDQGLIRIGFLTLAGSRRFFQREPNPARQRSARQSPAMRSIGIT